MSKKIKVYLASQIFAECWRDYNEKVAQRIEQEFPEVELYAPQRNASINDKTNRKIISQKNKQINQEKKNSHKSTN